MSEHVDALLSSSPVGVRVLRTQDADRRSTPVRVFYPAARLDAQLPRVPWFRNGAASAIDGYLHAFGGYAFKWCRHGTLAFRVLSAVGRLAARLCLGRLALPDFCRLDAEPRAGSRPLLVFSHGLFGTGDEHALFASLVAARLGYIVALVHHTDGSSSKVCCCVCGPPRDDDRSSDLASSALYYVHPDRGDDPAFREPQCAHRAEEVSAATRLVRGEFDVSDVHVGGFSFGAATAALAATIDPTAFVNSLFLESGVLFKEPPLNVHCVAASCVVYPPMHSRRFESVLLVDGWYSVSGRDLPSRAFASPSSSSATPPIKRAVFVGSAEFAAVHAFRDATNRLQARFAAAVADVVAATNHFNFMEICFWTPRWSLLDRRLFGWAPAGSPWPTKGRPPTEVYLDIVGRLLRGLPTQ